MRRSAPLAILALSSLALPVRSTAQVTADLAASPTDGLQQIAASASLTEGAAATVVNPAGLGLQEGFTLRYLHEQGITGGDFDGPGHGNGLYLGLRLFDPLSLGFAVEWIDDRPGLGDTRRTTWALALGGDALSVGANVHLFSSDADDLEDVISVDLGAMARPARWLSLGFAVRDVDGPRLGSVELPRRYVGSVGLRPVGDWLTLAVDGIVLGGEAPESESGFDHLTLGYTAHVEVLPGLRLVGGVAHRTDGDGPAAGQIGLALDFRHLGIEGAGLAQSGSGDAGGLFAAELRTEAERGIDLRPGATVAVVDLDRELARGSGLQLFPGRARDAMVDAIEGIHRLAGDRSVDALVVRLRSLPEVGQGEAWELRQALLDFRTSGKLLVALLEGGGDTEYYVASAAEQLYVTPEAALFVNGFASRVNFFADTLAIVGVRVDAVKVGAWKNAPDQLTRASIDEAHAEVVESILDDLSSRYVRDVARSRDLEEAAFRAALDTGIQSATLAQRLGLVDGILAPDELEKELGELLGRRASLRRTGLRPAPWESWGAAPVVAVIPIEGTITRGRTGGDFGLVETTGAESVVEALRSAADDPRVRAIVLRIDSGGGDAAGSQRIWRAVTRASERKPIVAAMGDGAASGGYFAAVGAQRIFAAPGTLTGSIGIFWLKPDLEELVRIAKVGTYRSTRGALADIGSIQDAWTEAERAAMQRYVDDAYRSFLEAVAQGRAMTVDEVDAVARGRVWTGAQALERKLVDELGGLSAAIRWARDRAGIAPEEPVEYRIYRPTPALFSTGPGFSLSLQTPRLELPEPLGEMVRRRFPAALLLPNEQGLWALAPFEVEID